MENREDMQTLDELHKATLMGMNSIGYVAEKVGDKNFKNELVSQYNQYNDILSRIVDSYNNIGKFPKEDKPINKMQTWVGVQLNTLNDKSNSKISEILIEGTTMGITKGKKLQNSNTHLNQNVSSILNDFVTMQENSINKLKTFL